jgi:hypothetical protein
MLNLLWKDLYLIRVNRSSWYILALFWLLLLVLSSEAQIMAMKAMANVLVAFLVTVTLSSGTEGMEAARHQELLFCSLPVKRAHLVYTSYSLTLILTAVGVGYTMAAGRLLAWLLPDRLFSPAAVMHSGEGLVVLSIMLFNAIFHNPLNFRFGSFGHRKLLYMGLITATVMVSFFLLPLAMIFLIQGDLSGLSLQEGGPVSPLIQLGRLLSEPVIMLGCGVVFLFLLVVSISLSVHYFNNREL